jgi:hypothetical protein
VAEPRNATNHTADDSARDALRFGALKTGVGRLWCDFLRGLNRSRRRVDFDDGFGAAA